MEVFINFGAHVQTFCTIKGNGIWQKIRETLCRKNVLLVKKLTSCNKKSTMMNLKYDFIPQHYIHNYTCTCIEWWPKRKRFVINLNVSSCHWNLRGLVQKYNETFFKLESRSQSGDGINETTGLTNQTSN